MSSGSWPNINLLIDTLWGGSSGFSADYSFVLGFVYGENPPYTLNDFLSVYPKFFGAASPFVATVTLGSNQITVSSETGLAAGQLITGAGIPNGTSIQVVSGTTVILTQNATASGTGVSLNVYLAPFVPIIVIQLYINLATACLVQARWQDQWYLAMAWFVAHYLTLWERSDGSQYTNAGQIANAGLERGMLVSKAVDGVSAGYQNLMSDFLDWGAWAETSYGSQLITAAATIGMGPMFVW